MPSSHAALDLDRRKPKAEKILRLLPLLADREAVLRLLEVGTGSGAIAHYFSALSSPCFDVWATDVEDQRVIKEGYQFQLYDGRHLPFDDEFFDTVISNHVIEHVGNRARQAAHVTELCRVLRPGGYVYLATPSRWQIVEPHFGLPFLSWISRGWRDRYVRIAGKGERYDCDLLRPVELRRLLQSSGLPYKNLNVQAFRELVALERPQSVLARAAWLLPSTWLEGLHNFSPTLIYLIHKPQHSDRVSGKASNPAMSLRASLGNHGEQD